MSNPIDKEEVIREFITPSRTYEDGYDAGCRYILRQVEEILSKHNESESFLLLEYLLFQEKRKEGD